MAIPGQRWPGFFSQISPTWQPADIDALCHAERMTEAISKPPVPTATGPDWPVIPLDENDADYRQLVRVATFAADMFALGPAALSMTRADVTRGQVAEGLALLLELGVIDIDRERLAAWTDAGIPMNRPRTRL